MSNLSAKILDAGMRALGLHLPKYSPFVSSKVVSPSTCITRLKLYDHMTTHTFKLGEATKLNNIIAN